MATRETLYMNLPGDADNTYYFPGENRIYQGSSAPSNTDMLWIDTDDNTETGSSNSGGGIAQAFFTTTDGVQPTSNYGLLWIDLSGPNGGLKYYNGSSWVHVPVAYT